MKRGKFKRNPHEKKKSHVRNVQTITLANKWNTNRSAPFSIGLECQTHVSTMVRNKQSLFSSQTKPQTTDWSSAKSTFRTARDYHRKTRTEAHTSIHGFEKGIPEINLFYCNERRGYLLFTKTFSAGAAATFKACILFTHSATYFQLIEVEATLCIL